MRAALFAGAFCFLTANQVIAQEALPSLPPPMPTITSPPVNTLTELTAATTGSPPSGRPFSFNSPRVWASTEYMLSSYTPMKLQTLISAVPGAEAGNPNPMTSIPVFPSQQKVKYDSLSGGRFRLGMNWETIGVDASAFTLQKRTLSTSVNSNGMPFAFTQPYVSAGDNTVTLLYSSIPNVYSGGITASVSSHIWGADMNLRRAWYVLLADDNHLLAGVRYFDLIESVAVSSTSVFPNGDTQNNADSIRTHNSFYAGQVGYSSQFGGLDRGIGLLFTTKSAVGAVNQRVDLVGSNSFTVNGVVDQESGGLYVRGLNTGSHSRNRLAYAHEIDFKVTYNFNTRFQVSLGYSLFYLSSVVRPGDQIDPIVNDTDIRFIATATQSTLARPAFRWNASEFVVQGLTVGMQLQY